MEVDEEDAAERPEPVDDESAGQSSAEDSALSDVESSGRASSVNPQLEPSSSQDEKSSKRSRKWKKASGAELAKRVGNKEFIPNRQFRKNTYKNYAEKITEKLSILHARTGANAVLFIEAPQGLGLPPAVAHVCPANFVFGAAWTHPLWQQFLSMQPKVSSGISADDLTLQPSILRDAIASGNITKVESILSRINDAMKVYLEMQQEAMTFLLRYNSSNSLNNGMRSVAEQRVSNRNTSPPPPSCSSEGIPSEQSISTGLHFDLPESPNLPQTINTEPPLPQTSNMPATSASPQSVSTSPPPDLPETPNMPVSSVTVSNIDNSPRHDPQRDRSESDQTECQETSGVTVISVAPQRRSKAQTLAAIQFSTSASDIVQTTTSATTSSSHAPLDTLQTVVVPGNNNTPPIQLRKSTRQAALKRVRFDV